MDRRTELLFDALAHPGAALVYELLRAGALVEDELIRLVPNTSQSTANRRLGDLFDLGVLVREPGPKQYKDRPWTVAVPDAAAALLTAVADLADTIARGDVEQRAIARAELREARIRRRNLQLVADEPST